MGKYIAMAAIRIHRPIGMSQMPNAPTRSETKRIAAVSINENVTYRPAQTKSVATAIGLKTRTGGANTRVNFSSMLKAIPLRVSDVRVLPTDVFQYLRLA